LNNCIGSKNYEAFFRLLLLYTFYNFNIIGMGIWTAKDNFANASLSFIDNSWGIIADAALTLLI
jgi:hypothetical protein